MKKTYECKVSATINLTTIAKKYNLTPRCEIKDCENAILQYGETLRTGRCLQAYLCICECWHPMAEDLYNYLCSSACKTIRKIKIAKINVGYIEFDDGTRITYDHDQDCCEDNYADFEQLRDTGIERETFTTPLTFEKAGEYGFRFGNPGKMYFVPCYSSQNGYYSADVNIYHDDRLVLELEGKIIDD